LAMEHSEYDFLYITAQAVRRMSAAELRHVQLNRKLRLDEEDYLKVIHGKTAALFSACCEIGAASTGADETLRQSLRFYGESLGMAFQLRDDVLDYVGHGTLWGKPAWQDLRERKLTLPVLIALQRMPSSERREFLRRWRAAVHSRRALEPLARQVLCYGGVEYTMERASQYAQRAREQLQCVPVSGAREALENFVEFVLERAW
ncbi:MAG: polyprenyl synthetase family protein, partial [Candidatus Kapabacteria bacterium]|nr:polyprenyl synthetase family protein [Candidatus Kapabacteria bacterium]MDW7996325.1 polyprenyl synthetase family protein [Bacteroidota bacterium]